MTPVNERGKGGRKRPSFSVLLDARLVIERPTGIGRYLAELLPRMLDREPDVDFHVLQGPDPWEPFRSISGPNLIRHRCGVPRMSLRQHWKIPALARRIGVDLIHYPHYDAPVLWGRVPVVATVHDLRHLDHRGYYRGGSLLKWAYARWSYRVTARRAKALIAVSAFTGEGLRTRFGVPVGRLFVIPEAVRRGFADVSPEAGERVRTQFSLNRPFLLSVGDLRPHKNHVTLIRAYGASSARKTHDLVIVGSPYRGYDAPNRAAEALPEGRVRFLADLQEGDLAALHRETDIFLLVSRHEGFGLPLLEAMASGAPVIASATTATGEVAGEAALRVDPSDSGGIAHAIDRILKDRALRADLVQRGAVRTAEFSWDRAAAQTIEVYRHVVNADRTEHLRSDPGP